MAVFFGRNSSFTASSNDDDEKKRRFQQWLSANDRTKKQTQPQTDKQVFQPDETRKVPSSNFFNNWLTSAKIAYRDWETDRKSTRLNSSHSAKSRMPSSA